MKPLCAKFSMLHFQFCQYMSHKKALNYHKAENEVQNHEYDIIQYLCMQIIILVTLCRNWTVASVV